MDGANAMSRYAQSGISLNDMQGSVRDGDQVMVMPSGRRTQLSVLAMTPTRFVSEPAIITTEPAPTMGCVQTQPKPSMGFAPVGLAADRASREHQ